MISTTRLRKYLQGKDRNARRLHFPTQTRLCILSRSIPCAAVQIRKSMEHTCTHRLQIQSQAHKNDKILRAAENLCRVHMVCTLPPLLLQSRCARGTSNKRYAPSLIFPQESMPHTWPSFAGELPCRQRIARKLIRGTRAGTRVRMECSSVLLRPAFLLEHKQRSSKTQAQSTRKVCRECIH